MKLMTRLLKAYQQLDNNLTEAVTLNQEDSSCQDVAKLPKDQQCQFVKSSLDCRSEKIPVFRWLYCDYTDHLMAVGVIIIFLLVILMFIIISGIADTCIVPNIGTIASVLRMSQTLAGVTVLAFGNGAPDVFTALASKLLGLSQIFYTALAGGCLFVTTVAAGIVLITKPFRIDGWSFIRDVTFLFISFFILFTCFFIGVVDLQACFTFIALYVIYIGTVLLSQWGNVKYEQKSIYSQYPLLREHRFSKISTLEIVEDVLLEHEHLAQLKHQNETIWSQFFSEILSFTQEEWVFMPWHERIWSCIQLPVTFVLKLTVPVCNEHHPNKGWSKLLIMINCVFIGPMFLYFADESTRNWGLSHFYGIPKFVYFILPSIAAAILIGSFTHVNKPPRYFFMVSFIGFPLSILLINHFCNFVVILFEGLGTKLGISYSTLGMTILAWGNSLGDLISNYTLAKNGMPQMGFAACYGSPIFICIFGGGVTSLVGLIESKETATSVSLGLTGGLVSYFMFATFICSIVNCILTDQDGRRSYGCFLITVYVTFLFMVVLAEVMDKIK